MDDSWAVGGSAWGEVPFAMVEKSGGTRASGSACAGVRSKLVASLVAKESGEQLLERVAASPNHIELGSRTPIFAGLYFLLLLAFWLLDRGIPGNRRRPALVIILGVLLVIASVLICVQVYAVGHSGAEGVWLQILSGTN